MSRRHAVMGVVPVPLLGAIALTFVLLSPDESTYPPLSPAMVDEMAKHGDTFAPDAEATRTRADVADRLGRRSEGSPRLAPEHTIAVSFGRATQELNDDVQDREVWVVYVDGYEAQCLGVCEPGAAYGVGDHYAFIDPETLRMLSAREF